jgi:hypothetical protein
MSTDNASRMVPAIWVFVPRMRDRVGFSLSLKTRRRGFVLLFWDVVRRKKKIKFVHIVRLQADLFVDRKARLELYT